MWPRMGQTASRRFVNERYLDPDVDSSTPGLVCLTVTGRTSSSWSLRAHALCVVDAAQWAGKSRRSSTGRRRMTRVRPYGVRHLTSKEHRSGRARVPGARVVFERERRRLAARHRDLVESGGDHIDLHDVVTGLDGLRHDRRRRRRVHDRGRRGTQRREPGDRRPVHRLLAGTIRRQHRRAEPRRSAARRVRDRPSTRAGQIRDAGKPRRRGSRSGPPQSRRMSSASRWCRSTAITPSCRSASSPTTSSSTETPERLSNDVVATYNARGEMARVGGVWRVSAVTMVQKWTGVAGCALAS